MKFSPPGILVFWLLQSLGIFHCNALTSIPTYFENASEEVRAEYRTLKARDLRIAQMQREKERHAHRLQFKQELRSSLSCPEVLSPELVPVVPTQVSSPKKEPNPLIQSLNQCVALGFAVFIGWLLWKNVLVPHVIEAYCGARKRHEPKARKIAAKSKKPESIFGRSESSRGNKKRNVAGRSKSTSHDGFKSSNEIVKVWVLD